MHINSDIQQVSWVVSGLTYSLDYLSHIKVTFPYFKLANAVSILNKFPTDIFKVN